MINITKVKAKRGGHHYEINGDYYSGLIQATLAKSYMEAVGGDLSSYSSMSEDQEEKVIDMAFKYLKNDPEALYLNTSREKIETIFSYWKPII